MRRTVRAIVREGKIEVLEDFDLPEGAKVLLTVIPDQKDEFWLMTSEVSLQAIWDNAEDDVYAQLLKK